MSSKNNRLNRPLFREHAGPRSKAGKRIVCVSVDQFRKTVRPGPILHNKLSASSEVRCRAIWDRIKGLDPNLGTTYEEFEEPFRRNRVPENEIGVYEKITTALDAYMRKHPGADRREIFLELTYMVSLRGIGRKELLELYGPPDLIEVKFDGTNPTAN